MNSRKVLIIISLIVFVISLSYGYGNAIITAGDAESITGIIDEINSEDNAIKIGANYYYFRHASIMDAMLEKYNISNNSEVSVSYIKEENKNFVINIKANKGWSKSGR
ncbi:MAG: hypothetical protein KKC46_20940 [Proteobacteria bacterium]|nr:hypothetical protein [Pseudomonadota bacterium]